MFSFILLALSIGQILCIGFCVSRANFLTTLRSHLDVTCSWYFMSCLFNVDVNYSCSLKHSEKIYLTIVSLAIVNYLFLELWVIKE